MIDEKDAFEMIHLVLQAGRQKSAGFEPTEVAVAVEVLGPDARGPRDLFPDLRHRETAFLEGREFFRRPQDFWIDVDARIALAILLVEVHHDDAPRYADLNG